MTAGAASAQTAIDGLIESFGRHDRDAYFGYFAEDATFMFHSSPARLESRAEYETLWREWETLGEFQVLSCASTNRRLQLFGNTAVFSHDVLTEARMAGITETIAERETIVMQFENEKWLCVHEHLSIGAVE